jgi:hypothetical protein
MMLSSLLDSPRFFAQCILTRQDYSDFEHIIRCIVPSVFGFFSSEEHLTHALAFYSHLVEQAKPQLAVLILRPFFHSAATFRFLEFALDDFFKTFLFDYTTTPEENRATLVPAQGATLIQCFINAAPLLPEPHLRILRQLKNKSWPSQYFADLVLVKWLWPVTWIWMKASPCANESQYLAKVLTAVGCQKQLIRRLYRALFSARSVHTIPALFKSIDTNYLTFYLCVNDICLLARLLEDQGLLPCGLTLNDFLEVDVNYQYYWFCCQVFPRAWIPLESPKYRLVFPDSLNALQPGAPSSFQELVKLANCFEIFMDESRKAENLRQWSELISTNVTLLMTSDLQYLMAHPEIPVSRGLRQLMTLSCFDETTFGMHYNEIVQYGRRWDRLVASSADERELKRRIDDYEAIRRCIWGGIRLIRSTKKVKLPRRFQLLMTAMTQFDAILQRPEFGMPLLSLILRHLPGQSVIVPFVIFNGAIAHEADFMSEEERRIWIKLETCLLTILKDDPDLLAMIGRKQIELQTLTGKQMRRVIRLEAF